MDGSQADQSRAGAAAGQLLDPVGFGSARESDARTAELDQQRNGVSEALGGVK
jgi:hypothetical protein